MNSGYVLVALSFLFLVIGGYAILFSAFLPLSGIAVRTSDVVTSNASSGRQALDALALDTHYKYFVVLIIPMTVYFVIANWVGWQYFRNS